MGVEVRTCTVITFTTLWLRVRVGFIFPSRPFQDTCTTYQMHFLELTSSTKCINQYLSQKKSTTPGSCCLQTGVEFSSMWNYRITRDNRHWFLKYGNLTGRYFVTVSSVTVHPPRRTMHVHFYLPSHFTSCKGDHVKFSVQIVDTNDCRPLALSDVQW